MANRSLSTKSLFLSFLSFGLSVLARSHHSSSSSSSSCTSVNSNCSSSPLSKLGIILICVFGGLAVIKTALCVWCCCIRKKRLSRAVKSSNAADETTDYQPVPLIKEEGPSWMPQLFKSNNNKTDVEAPPPPTPAPAYEASAFPTPNAYQTPYGEDARTYEQPGGFVIPQTHGVEHAPNTYRPT